MSSLLARALRLSAGAIGQKPDSMGPAVLVTGSAEPGNDFTPEVWGPAGFASIPPDGVFGVLVPVGLGRFGFILGVQNPKLSPPVTDKGGATFYSTSADGATLKASIKARADGTLEINGTGKFLVTHAELNLALQTMLTAINANFGTKLNGAGTPGATTLDISTAKAQTLKTGG